jgi:8-oxo-dGTP diphosphatase
MSAERTPIVVIAAVIERDGRILVGRRLKGTHLADLWEFPGGKCDSGETHEACLVREIDEELGVRAHVGEEILSVEHTYPEKRVRLHFRACAIEGEPRPMIGQELQWVERAGLRSLEFPEADTQLIEILTNTRRT